MSKLNATQFIAKLKHQKRELETEVGRLKNELRDAKRGSTEACFDRLKTFNGELPAVPEPESWAKLIEVAASALCEQLHGNWEDPQTRRLLTLAAREVLEVVRKGIGDEEKLRASKAGEIYLIGQVLTFVCLARNKALNEARDALQLFDADEDEIKGLERAAEIIQAIQERSK